MQRFQNSSRTLFMIFGATVLVLGFQNCSNKNSQADASAVLSSKLADDDASLAIPKFSASSSQGSGSAASGTTTITNSGSGSASQNIASNSGSCAPLVINGNSSQVTVISGQTITTVNGVTTVKANESNPTVSCASLGLADIKLPLDQVVIKQGNSEVVLASLSGQFLSRDNMISFVAAASVSDVEQMSLILLKSGHQFMNTEFAVKAMSLKDSSKKGLSVALSQRRFFEKGRTYQVRLKLSESSSLEDDGVEQCLLRPVLEVQ